MDDDLSAPPELRNVEAFLNTVDERTFSHRGVRHASSDVLTTRAALSTWLVGHGLLARAARVSNDDLAAAIALRTSLRDAMTVTIGQMSTANGVRRVNSALAGFPLRLELGDDGALTLAPEAGGVRGALATIVASVAGSNASGTWSRLRICAAVDCRWVFYDNSRNGAGRWCSMAVCGNRDKTRRYRERLGGQ